MRSSSWFITIHHTDNSDTKDIHLELEDGTGIIDKHQIETARNIDSGVLLTVSIFTAVSIDEEQFEALRKQLTVEVNGVPSVIIHQTNTDAI
tara:strand:+ start:336 stop:611 length:276 start_codon:yes stop_codon:yes gene_type:complete